MPQTKLSDLSAGTMAVIARLPTGIPSLTRLRELGVLPGTKVTLVRRAPLGDPIELKIRGALLAVRFAEASQIEVELPARPGALT